MAKQMIKKFNAVEYLVQKYVEGEYAIIPIQLKKAEDFFNPLDPTQTTLSPKVSGYIDHCVYNIPIRFKVKLKVVCDEVCSEDMKIQMQNAVKHHYGLIVYDKNLDLRTNTYKTLWLVFWGIFFLALTYIMGLERNLPLVLDGGENILREILLVAGWFFVWEAVENFVLDRKRLRDDKINNKQMLNAELFFETESEINKYQTEEGTNEKDKIEELYNEKQESFEKGGMHVE